MLQPEQTQCHSIYPANHMLLEGPLAHPPRIYLASVYSAVIRYLQMVCSCLQMKCRKTIAEHSPYFTDNLLRSSREVCTHTYMHTHTHTHTHTHIYVHTQTLIHIHTHTHIQRSSMHVIKISASFLSCSQGFVLWTSYEGNFSKNGPFSESRRQKWLALPSLKIVSWGMRNIVKQQQCGQATVPIHVQYKYMCAPAMSTH